MIYLVRHGEAAAKWGEAPDPGLSARGQTQAETVAQKLTEIGAKSAITSPMQRCRETAHPFERALGITATLEPRVTEIETPPGAGGRTGWLQSLMSGNWNDTQHDYTPWRTHMLDAIRALPDETAVFTHFIAINAIVGLIEDRPEVTLFRPDNCSITTLDRTESGFTVKARGTDIETRVL